MRLILSELRKLASARAVSVFLIVLLSANFALTFFTTCPLPVEMAAREVYDQYLSDPEALISYKEQLEADFFEHIREEDFEMPSTFIDGADDMSVLNRVFGRAEYIQNYREEIQKTVDSAERRARDLGYFGYSEDSFYIREQRELARIYGELTSVLDGENEYAYGYDVYFESSHVCLFILIWLLFAVSFIFRNDRVCGFGSIMRASKCGRLGSACAKIAVTVIVSIFATLIFLGTTLIAVGLSNGGFSSAEAPVQLLPGYAKVPLEVSMLGYLSIQTCFRLIAAVVFALFVALVASLGFNYVFCFGIGAIFAAGNYFVFSREYLGTTPPFKYLNIASAADGVELFSFHRDVNFFGTPMPHGVILTVICVISGILISLLCALFYCKNYKIYMPKAANLKKIALRIGRKDSKSGLRARSVHPLWVYELLKNRFLPLAFVAIALLMAHCAFVGAKVGSGATYGEAIYYGYIADIKILDAEERSLYLAKERARLEAVIYEYEHMTEAYKLDEITQDEYGDYLEKYYKAKDKERALQRVEEYSRYIDRKSTSIGIDCDVIYNTGYEQFFGLGTNWFLFAAIVILSVGIFSVEYQSGNCAQIIRAAKKGRKETFFSKLLPYVVIGAILGVVFRASGLMVTASNYELADPDATLCSIRRFEAVMSVISIRQYLVIDMICSMLAGMFAAGAVCALSCIFKRTLHNLGAVGVMLALPALLSKTEFALINLTLPNSVYCSAFKVGTEYHTLYFGATILFHLFTVSALALVAMRSYVGKTRR